ncbi:hypothetical protein [Aquabacterium sp.]|uniref:hypothetical protein n=1 Tax=Aquabacterium sp. TaxID=1872578 RepID=UPI002BF8BD37|nr:hypothetical protein [Aquabacterium sp.]HSW05447.1 hypothetical protein [Aquabacterium sp.]
MLRAAWLAPLLLAAALAAAAPLRAAEPACTLVVGHGRNLALDDHEANTAWNQVNNLFNAQVAGQLQRAGWRVLRLPLPVEARDLPSNVRTMLDRAQDGGCDQLLETTIFADDEAQLLVVRLRAHPLATVRNLAGPGAMLMIGEPIYTSQRDMRLLLRSLDTLSPADLARDMAADFIRQNPR